MKSQLFVGLSLLFAVTNAQGATLTSLSGQDISVPATTVLKSRANGNDNIGATGTLGLNLLQFRVTFDNMSPKDVQFTVNCSGALANATSEYSVAAIMVNHVPGVHWTTLKMSMGFYDSNLNFIPANSSTNLDFDAPNFDSPVDSTYLTSISHAAETMVFASSSASDYFPSPGTGTFADFWDIPGGANIPSTANGYNYNTSTGLGTYRFVLRIEPNPVVVSIPEPSAGAVAALMFIVVLPRRRTARPQRFSNQA